MISHAPHVRGSMASRSSRVALMIALVALCSVAPAIARAAPVPSPANCTIPSHVVLVGRDASGAADPLGSITLVIRKLTNEPIAQASISIDFHNTEDMQPSLVQPDPSVTVFCGGGKAIVRAFTDNNGQATIRIVGRAFHSVPGGAQAPTLDVFANGVLLGTVPVSAFDQDGGGGVNPADESLFFADFFSGQYWARSDFDGNGALGPNDLSLWEQAFFASNSVQSGGASACP